MYLGQGFQPDKDLLDSIMKGKALKFQMLKSKSWLLQKKLFSIKRESPFHTTIKFLNRPTKITFLPAAFRIIYDLKMNTFHHAFELIN